MRLVHQRRPDRVERLRCVGHDVVAHGVGYDRVTDAPIDTGIEIHSHEGHRSKLKAARASDWKAYLDQNNIIVGGLKKYGGAPSSSWIRSPGAADCSAHVEIELDLVDGSAFHPRGRSRPGERDDIPRLVHEF